MRARGGSLRVRRDTQNLRTLTRSTVHAGQVAGRIVHVQEQCRNVLRVAVTVRHQLSLRRIHEQVRHARRIATEPQLRCRIVEHHRISRINHSRSGERARSGHRVRNLGRLSLGVQAQNAQRNSHHQSVRIHDVGVRITPGAVQRVQGVLNGLPLAVAALRNLHQRVVQALLTHRLQAVVARAVLVGVNEHVVGAARGHLLPVTPGGNTEGQARLGGIRTGSLQCRHVRGGTHVLQVHAGIRTHTQLRGRDARARSAQLKSTQQGAVTALIHRGTLQGQGLLGRAGTLSIEGDIGASHTHRGDRLRCHVQRHAQGLHRSRGISIGQDQAARSARNVLAGTRNGDRTGRVVYRILVRVHGRVAGLLQLRRVNAHRHGERCLLAGTHRHGLRVGELHTRDARAALIVQGVGVRHRVGVLNAHAVLQGLHTGVRGVLEHAESVRNLFGACRVEQQHLAGYSSRGVDTAGTHTVHRVGVAPGVLHVVVGGVHDDGLKHARTVLRVRLHDQRRNTGNKGRGHGRTGLHARTGAATNLDGGNVRARCRNVRLGDAVRTVQAARGGGVRLIQLAVGHANRVAQVLAELQGQLTRINLRGKALHLALCQAHARNGGVTADSGVTNLSVRGEHHAGCASRLQVVEAYLRTAGCGAVSVRPVDESPLALQRCGFLFGECLAGVAVAGGGTHHGAAQLLLGRLRIVEAHRVVAVGVRLVRGGENLHAVHQLGRADGVRHGQAVGAGAGAARVGVGVAHGVVVVGVTRRNHGEDALAVEGADRVVHGLIEHAELVAERQVRDVGAVGEVAVVVGVEHAVQALGDERGGALTTENAQTNQLGVRCGAGADLHVVELLFGELGVVAVEGAAVRVHAVTCRGARHVATVAAAVERVVIRVGSGGFLLTGVVIVTDQVVAAKELLRIVGALGNRVGCLCLLEGFLRAGATQIGVRVVDTGIEHDNLHALAGVAGGGGVCRALRPHGERVRINEGAAVLRCHVLNDADAFHIVAVRERTNLLDVTVERHAAHRVVGGVQDLRAGFLRRGGALLLHAGADCLHLCLRVDGCLRAGADRVRLGLGVRALTLESDEHGAFAGGAVQAGGENFVVVLAGAGVLVGRVPVCAAYYARCRVGGGTER